MQKTSDASPPALTQLKLNLTVKKLYLTRYWLLLFKNFMFPPSLNPPNFVYYAQYPLFIWTSPSAYIQSLGSVHAKAGHALFKDSFLGTSLLHEPRKLKNAVTKGSDYEPKSKVSNRMFFSKVLTLK